MVERLLVAALVVLRPQLCNMKKEMIIPQCKRKLCKRYD